MDATWHQACVTKMYLNQNIRLVQTTYVFSDSFWQVPKT